VTHLHPQLQYGRGHPETGRNMSRTPASFSISPVLM
jgi:hypothetical protein